MEISNSHRNTRRSTETTDSNLTISGTSKRRRFDSQYRSQRDFNVNLTENFASTAVSGSSDHVTTVVSSSNHDSITDLKIEFESSNDDFSEKTSESSVICLKSEQTESLSNSPVPASEVTSRRAPPLTTELVFSLNPEEINSLSNSTQKNSNNSASENEATSRCEPPSAAELEEFFSKAEKYEQKRFAEKYNYDIVKDVPVEGRYQWIQL